MSNSKERNPQLYLTGSSMNDETIISFRQDNMNIHLPLQIDNRGRLVLDLG